MTLPMTVLYNDSCPICAREIAAYRRYTERLNLDVTYLGIVSTDLSRYGLTKRDAARRLHVLYDGDLVSGVPAFALIWDQVAHLRWLARAVRLPVIRPMSYAVYDHILAPMLFAMHRRRERLGKATTRG